MANEAPVSSSSHLEPGFEEEEDDDLIYGSESGWVEARTSCDHLGSLSSDLAHIPTPDTPCHRCQHPTENWLCLCCKFVLCSRFVNKHMLQHYQQMNHCLALSYSDLSVWCFACDAYLDSQVYWLSTGRTIIKLFTDRFPSLSIDGRNAWYDAPQNVINGALKLRPKELWKTVPSFATKC